MHVSHAPRALALVFAAAAALLPAPRSATADQVWESRENNVVLRIPEDPAPWEWLSFSPDWTSVGIIKGARRVPDKLKDGKPTEGHGALLHLVRREAPKDATLESVAADAEVRGFFLKRFAGTEENVETENTTVVSISNPEGHPAIVLRAEGKAPDLRAQPAACNGVMIITVAKGFLYLVRMYAFPTEFDREGLVVDLDFMEGNCLELLDTKEEAKVAPPPPADGGNGGGEETPAEELKEETFENQGQKWRIVKHAKLKQIAISDEDRKNDVELMFQDSDRMGTYTLILYAIPLGRIVDGQQVKAPDLVKWMTTDWWSNFTTNHAKGAVETFKWPRKTKEPTFITLPELDDPKAKVELFGPDDKRPVEVDAADMIKKFGAVEKPKKNDIGKHGKGVEALRGILQGRHPTAGVETLMRFAWRSPSHSYRLFVSITGEAYKRWGEALRSTLESLEFGVKFR